MDIIRVKKVNRGIPGSSLIRRGSSLELSKGKEYNCKAYVFGEEFNIDHIDIIQKKNIKEGVKKEEEVTEFGSLTYMPDNFFQEEVEFSEEDYAEPMTVKKIEISKIAKSISFRKRARAFAIFAIVAIITGGFFVSKGINIKEEVLGISDEAINNVDVAIKSITESDFSLSSDKFDQAYNNFSNMSDSLEELGVAVISVSRFVPGASQLSSGYELTQAGKYLSSAGKKISQVAKNLKDLKEASLNLEDEETISALNIFYSFEKDIITIEDDLAKAQGSLEKVKLKDVPKEKRDAIEELKIKLPIIIQGVEEFSKNSHIMADLLGANGPRKYLFLFQNNQEMRATGGFIGSYGLLDIEGSGRIRNFFVDGIFNPDGQLTDKIVPPRPIQKISAAWSLHDSNWFPNFPLSAQKAISFYEKTGGPTVDGVVTLTPTVMQKLLEITGPIYMEEYDVELNSDNFIQDIQYEVEEDYDKEENRPKKILSDLAPLVLDRLLSSNDMKVLAKTAKILVEALQEKHILIYSSNKELQEIISNVGWSGEVLNTSKDYLSVINSNINGYKTDGVIEEKINHQTEISREGSIIDTVTVVRKHNGGNEKYEWWNKVNSNYMRVYVPEGSELLEVEGQTREFNDPPLDYRALNFERDVDVEREENSMQVDEITGTRIYNEAGKTVFANWVYVSPQEEVTVKYKYKLPFRMDLNFERQFDSFSLLCQKQSGSLGSKFNYSFIYPKEWNVEWKTENSEKGNLGELKSEDMLEKDRFFGVVFSSR